MNLLKFLPPRKWVYVFNIRPTTFFPPFLWLGKVGFESDETDRAAGVEYSIREKLGLEVKVQRVIRVKVFMYRGIEKAVHNVLKILHSNRLKGCSGWTEIFNILNVFSGLITLIVCYGFGIDCASWLALCVILIPYPIDMVIFVLLLAGVEYVIIAAVGLFVIYHAFQFL